MYYVGTDRGLHYIVFEFIEGENLRDMVERKGPLPATEAISYALQISEALAHASQRDVIHRDIKPSNVLDHPRGPGQAGRHGAGPLAPRRTCPTTSRPAA